MVRVRHVLVPMGNTERSERALVFALEEYPEARISVIHVTESSDPLGLFGRREVEDYLIPDRDGGLEDELVPDGSSFNRAQRKRAEQVFTRACQIADGYGTDIELIVRSGDVVEEIRSYTDAEAVDRIVIADHQPTGVRPRIRGVSASIARHAAPPVTMIG
ncbi:universal stress protein [Halomicroarcula limicola]|uniref:Universal stress protein n=1 Tax=Haloarcula limicola TaxID=1429915 RepID=A0A8J7YAG1_9EURY|nr:universal stress protein [Halomicroarcula limicola]MBV0923646.1 universal stress protein [Halomicroarcula limicola]